MGDLFGIDTGISISPAMFIWPIVSTVLIFVLWYGAKFIARKINKKRARAQMYKDVDELYQKYSDLLVEKIVNKLNNNNNNNDTNKTN